MEAVACGGAEKVPVDRVDQLILRTLCTRGFSSHAAAARSLGMPKSTVDCRVQSLEQKGIVRGYAMRLNAQALGIGAFRLMLNEKHPSTIAAALEKHSASSPYVTCYLRCVGNWDYELSVRVPEPGVVPEIVQELYTCFGGELSNLITLTVLRTLKYRMFPFTAELAL